MRENEVHQTLIFSLSSLLFPTFFSTRARSLLLLTTRNIHSCVSFYLPLFSVSHLVQRILLPRLQLYFHLIIHPPKSWPSAQFASLWCIFVCGAVTTSSNNSNDRLGCSMLLLEVFVALVAQRETRVGEKVETSLQRHRQVPFIILQPFEISDSRMNRTITLAELETPFFNFTHRRSTRIRLSSFSSRFILITLKSFQKVSRLTPRPRPSVAAAQWLFFTCSNLNLNNFSNLLCSRRLAAILKLPIWHFDIVQMPWSVVSWTSMVGALASIDKMMRIEESAKEEEKTEGIGRALFAPNQNG